MDGWARKRDGRKIAAVRTGERKQREWKRKRQRKTKGNGVNPAPGRPIYRGIQRIYTLRFLLPYNAPQRLYPEKFARKSRRNFR
jgi:hypothetical protein